MVLDLVEHQLGLVGVQWRFVVQLLLHPRHVEIAGPFGDHHRGDAIALNSIRIQRLAKHEQRFAMRVGIPGLDGKIDIGRQGNVPGHFLPHKVKCIGC